MRTIVEPKEHVDKLWGKQRIRDGDTYRMMRYVLRVDYDGKVLLHNVVTGRLVVLDQSETEAVNKLPLKYEPVMEQLVAEHYLVSDGVDEHQQVVNLRNILFKLTDVQKPKEVTSYLILPTTACNARCWYCFEKGITPETMTDETANDVVDFIERNCGKKKVYIWWFGGEPTIAANRIDQICTGLQERGIEYFSDITTNGYLFDKDMVERAKNLWHLRLASISLDGTEANYNKTKAFQNARDNPYLRMMRNVELLLAQDIAVALRMNFDHSNYHDFDELLKEVRTRFPLDAHLMVYPHQINQDYPEEQRYMEEKWLNSTYQDLAKKACDVGLYRREKAGLPCLNYGMCGAANDRWYIITPSGGLACCGEQITDDQIKGDIKRGVTNRELEEKWKQFADSKRCSNCILFPKCAINLHCRARDRCAGNEESLRLCYQEICRIYDSQLNHLVKEGEVIGYGVQ